MNQIKSSSPAKRLRTLASCGCAVIALAVMAGNATGDWPQWQGPDRNAVSQEKGLLQEWPAEGPQLAWKVQGLGGGDSAPSIAEGRIFVMGTRGDEEVVRALAEKDGKELWVQPLGRKFQ